MKPKCVCWDRGPVVSLNVHLPTRSVSLCPNCLHFKCMLSHFRHVQFIVTPWTVAHRLLCPWDSPGKNTGVGCHALLQQIPLTQESNPSLLCLLQCRRLVFHPWVGKTPLEKGMATYSSILAGESHGQRSLASYSPWCHKESDTTDWANTFFIFIVD